MSEEEKDKSQKTEQPTEKRKEEARKEGQIAYSKEITLWAVMFASSVVLFGFGPAIIKELKGTLIHFLSHGHELAFSGPSIMILMRSLLGELVKILAFPAIFLILFALIGGFLQTGMNFSSKSLKPKMSRLSPLEWVKRTFSMKGGFEIFKMLFKLTTVVTVGFFVIEPYVQNIELLHTLSIAQCIPTLAELLLKFFSATLAVMFIFAILDFLYQKMTILKDLKMSREELKKESKDAEGDPHIKGRLRQIRMSRARRRMMSQVPEASVVITNPTHFAVALKYDAKTMSAPVVVAKGQDLIALRIREIAGKNDIPLVEDPPLARSLYGSVELDQEIPIEMYEAVAAVIRYVMKKEGKKF